MGYVKKYLTIEVSWGPNVSAFIIRPFASTHNTEIGHANILIGCIGETKPHHAEHSCVNVSLTAPCMICSPPPCSPTAIQYVFLHEEKFDMTPASTRPMTKPDIKPDRVMLIARALRLEGARSAVHGIQICGVT